MTSVEEKLVQYRLGWFGHIQRKATETSIRNGVIRRINNEKRDRERSNLIWEKYVKRDLNDCCITKELALDRRELKLTIYVPESWSSVPSLLLLFCQVFSRPFSLFWLCVLLFFSFFDLVFYHPFFLYLFFFTLVLSCFFARVVSSLTYPNLFENKNLGCFCCYCLIIHLIKKIKLLKN
jgi:hypothetical protein